MGITGTLVVDDRWLESCPGVGLLSTASLKDGKLLTLVETVWGQCGVDAPGWLLDRDSDISSPGSSSWMYPRSDLHCFQFVSITLFSKIPEMCLTGYFLGKKWLMDLFTLFHTATFYLKNFFFSAVKHTIFDDLECSFLIRYLGSDVSMSKIVKALLMVCDITEEKYFWLQWLQMSPWEEQRFHHKANAEPHKSCNSRSKQTQSRLHELYIYITFKDWFLFFHTGNPAAIDWDGNQKLCFLVAASKWHYQWASLHLILHKLTTCILVMNVLRNSNWQPTGRGSHVVSSGWARWHIYICHQNIILDILFSDSS